ncbi:hypothetical protein [Planomonospora sp. ID82291]|uniref:hypothetical protein n=1 Tax=Planomonospora sp. ID82291 TaxID=2738136 RepID=UPI0018C3DFF6|nr:hypothetical protein [Planomonospora sp. ID82291]MBG0818191.1 hypothetical protein [Planomonospora sp. ID82291]
MDHSKHRGGHFAVLATIGETAQVEILQPIHNGVLQEPAARIRFRVDGRNSEMEIPPALAWDLANFLLAIDFRLIQDIASALRLPYYLTGEPAYEVAPKKEEA